MKKLAEFIRLLRGLENAFHSISKNQPIQVHWVSRRKASEIYDVSLRQILNWKQQGLIEYKEINGKVYYSILPLTLKNDKDAGSE